MEVGDDISQDEINQKLNAIVSLIRFRSSKYFCQPRINVPKIHQKWARPAYIVFKEHRDGTRGSAWWWACRAESHNISPSIFLNYCSKDPGRECSNNQFHVCLLDRESAENSAYEVVGLCMSHGLDSGGFWWIRLVSAMRERVKVLEDEEVSELTHVMVSTYSHLVRRVNITLLLIRPRYSWSSMMTDQCM